MSINKSDKIFERSTNEQNKDDNPYKVILQIRRSNHHESDTIVARVREFCVGNKKSGHVALSLIKNALDSPIEKLQGVPKKSDMMTFKANNRWNLGKYEDPMYIAYMPTYMMFHINTVSEVYRLKN